MACKAGTARLVQPLQVADVGLGRIVPFVPATDIEAIYLGWES